jgi:hypothetical protein
VLDSLVELIMGKQSSRSAWGIGSPEQLTDTKGMRVEGYDGQRNVFVYILVEYTA